MPQTVKKLVPFLGVIVLMCASTSALAQGTTSGVYPKVEVFAGYSASGEANNPRISFGPTASVQGDYASPTGFETSVIGNFNKHFGIKGDFSAHLDNDSACGPLTACTPTCITATQDNQFKSRLYNFLAGPEFKARNSTRFTPFAYALAGVAHTSATFTSTSAALNVFLKKSDNSFAMAFGGGLDIRAIKRVSVRGSMDYNPVFIRDSGTDRRDLLRVSLGVLFH
jgi:opacity protein-like surface antigen